MSGELHSETQNLEPTVRRQTLIALGLSFILTAVYFYDIVFTDKIFADRDTLLVYMPMFKYWAERILSGEWPDWFPYDGLGQPYAGAMVGIAFHPIKVLFLLMNVGTAMKWATLLCFPIAFNGMFHLCRSLKLDWRAAFMGALLFTFNGYMVSMTNSLAYLLGMASLPWCWWLTVRVYRQPSFARIFLAALSYALMLFTGEVQSFITACMTGLVFAILLDGWQGRRGKAFLIYCGVMGLACLMCAVQWVPALHVMHQGITGAFRISQKSTLWSFQPARILEIALDGITGHGSGATVWFSQKVFKYEASAFWARSVYFGIPGLYLCLLAFWKNKKVFWTLLGAILFVLTLALGRHVGLYEALQVIPLFAPLRYPEKCIALLMALLSLMAAYGYSSAADSLLSLRNKYKTACIIACSVIAILIMEVVFHVISNGCIDLIAHDAAALEAAQSEIRSEIRAFVLLSLAAAFMIIVLMILAHIKNSRSLAAISAILIFIQLRISSGYVYQATDAFLLEEQNMIVDIIKQEASDAAGASRYLSLSDRVAFEVVEKMGLESQLQTLGIMVSLKPDYGALFGLEAFSTYLPAASRRLVELKGRIKNFEKLIFLAGLYSVSHFTIFAEDYAKLGGSVENIAYEHPELGALLIRLDGFMPRAYLSRPICLSEKGIDGFLKAFRSKKADFTKYTMLECSADIASGGRIGSDIDIGSASIVFRKPEHVAIDVDAKTDGSVLVLTDAYYSGWTATIDGSPAEILPANHAVRGVMMPKGKHRVEFKYRTPGLIPAAIVSLGTMLVSAVVAIILSRRRRQNHSDRALA